ncbi:DUF3667 domain-containing protein [bacterium]
MRHNKFTRCLNCKERIDLSNYCPNCGQENRDRQITVRQMIRDFLGDYFTFDSKFLHSIVPLITKPGHLTKEYIAGRRIRYISPFRLYIFTTFIFFFILMLNSKLDQKRIDQVIANESVIANDSLLIVLDKYNFAIPKSIIENIYQEIDTTYVLTLREHYNRKRSRFTFANDQSGDSKLRQYLHKKGKYLNNLGEHGWTIFLKEMIIQIPKVVFFILPIFAFFLKLLYIRHKQYYIEHFIFTLHFHTFVFISLIIPVIYPKWFVIAPVILIVYIYLLLAMRLFYEQSFLKTWIKTHLLLFLYSFAFLPAFILLFLLVVLTV